MTVLEFLRIFQVFATQLSSDETGRQWYGLGFTPETAARWANIGYMTGEALRAMADGVTLPEAERAAARAHPAAHIWRRGRLIA